MLDLIERGGTLTAHQDIDYVRRADPLDQPAAVEAAVASSRRTRGPDGEYFDGVERLPEHTHGFGDADESRIVRPHAAVDQAALVVGEAERREVRRRGRRGHGHLPHRDCVVSPQPSGMGRLEQVDAVLPDVERRDHERRRALTEDAVAQELLRYALQARRRVLAPEELARSPQRLRTGEDRPHLLDVHVDDCRRGVPSRKP